MFGYKIAPVILLIFAMVALVAASGCGLLGGEEEHVDPFGDSSDVSLADPEEAFDRSVRRFQEEVTSFRADMTLSATVDEEVVTATAEMSLQKPDQFYLRAERSDGGITGSSDGGFEMLQVDGSLYMTDTFFMSGQPFVMEIEDELLLEATLTNSAFVDYPALVEVFDEIEDLGEESLDDETYRRFRTTVQYRDYVGVLSETLVQPEVLGDLLPNEFVTPDLPERPIVLDVDIWTYPYSYVPYRIELVARYPSSPVSEMSFQYSGYNGEITMPSPPREFVSFEDAALGFFEDLEDADAVLDGDIGSSGNGLAINFGGPIVARDVHLDGSVAAGDRIDMELHAGAGSEPLNIAVMLGPDKIFFFDSEDGYVRGNSYVVTDVQVTPVSGNGDEWFDENERWLVSVEVPIGVSLEPDEEFIIEIQFTEHERISMGRTMPHVITSEIEF